VYTGTFADGIADRHDSALWNMAHLIALDFFVSPDSMWLEECIILVVHYLVLFGVVTCEKLSIHGNISMRLFIKEFIM
jgi:hypothetical protein